MNALEKQYNSILKFATANERKLGAVLFAFGFLTDLFTFGTLPIEIVNWFFVTYLILAGVTIIGSHTITTFKTRDAWWKKTVAALFPLGVQYAFGGLFSGFVVFYARSSVFSVSWPFLLLLALVYAGNEYFRKEREHFIFQTLLFFIALYAYTIFALPLLSHSIGPVTFIGSTAAALVLFGLFLLALYYIHRVRVLESARFLGSAVIATTLIITSSYFLGLIPPLPLALTDSGVYHSVERVSGGYKVQSEAQAPWWHIGAPTLHITPGASISGFSAVHAPILFSSAVVHRWEHYDEKKGKWVTESKISFPISGGREGGYRGYTTKSVLAEGKWRISVETHSGQTIGRIRFNVEHVLSGVPLEEGMR